jgi:hypothetical protein
MIDSHLSVRDFVRWPVFQVGFDVFDQLKYFDTLFDAQGFIYGIIQFSEGLDVQYDKVGSVSVFLDGIVFNGRQYTEIEILNRQGDWNGQC